MATPFQSSRVLARSCRCKFSPGSNIWSSIDRRRRFTTTPSQCHEENKTAKTQALLERVFKIPGTENTLQTELQEKLRERLEEKLSKIDGNAKKQMQRERGALSADHDIGDAPNMTYYQQEKPKRTFLNMGEKEVLDNEPLEQPEDREDLNTMGYEELEHHREKRHYARLAAWELPLLSKMAKPFELPSADTPLRFRYTTYMGEQHPAENKVVLEFCPEDMPDLTAIQKDKIRKLAGPRYNPETDIVKMSTESFETLAKNKRYLGDLVDKFLAEAKDPRDTFEDVPLYTGHHVFKKKPRFPPEWRLSEERIAELAAYRQGIEQRDQQLLTSGQLVDGVKQIGEALARARVLPQEEPVMALTGKGKVGIRR